MEKYTSNKLIHKLFIHIYLFTTIVVSCQPKELLTSTLNVASFQFKEAKVSDVVATENLVTVRVPYGTNVKSLTPTFLVEGEGQIIPSLTTSFDFSVPVYFTVVHPSGGKIIYTIKVVTEEQPTPIISSFSVDSLEAGERFIIKGGNFGKFGLDIKTALLNEKTVSSVLQHRLIDSTQLEIFVPDTLSPSTYAINVQVKEKNVLSSKRIRILYPTPLLEKTHKINYLQQDTVYVSGRFLDSERYTFHLLLSNSASEYYLPFYKLYQNSLGFIVPKNTKPGTYSVAIENTSEKKISKKLATPLTILDKINPYVVGISGNKTAFKAGETVRFSTINFLNFPIRFYQVQLKNNDTTIFQNGIFDAKSQELSLVLPENLTKGNYQLSFFLNHPEKAYSYSFSIDIQLQVY